MALVIESFEFWHEVQGRVREAAELYEASSKMFRATGSTLAAAKLDERASAVRMR